MSVRLGHSCPALFLGEAIDLCSLADAICFLIVVFTELYTHTLPLPMTLTRFLSLKGKSWISLSRLESGGSVGRKLGKSGVSVLYSTYFDCGMKKNSQRY